MIRLTRWFETSLVDISRWMCAARTGRLPA